MESSLVGSKLGKYEIIELIGRGGMATVYKAYHAEIDRYVAVKVLPPHPDQDAAFVERFKLEARTIARMQHPHILPLYDYSVENNIFYLAMAYIEGGSLSNLIDRGPMSLQEVEQLLWQIAPALDYAHRQGIVHRDIKPDNILLDKEGYALLADFGIAKIRDGDTNMTATGGMIGTPAYMAPEQCQGLGVTSQADIYALGVVAYEMLTGEQPFIADTPVMVIVKHVNEPVPSIRKIIDHLPQKLEPVMMRVMAKMPEDRYATATQFVQDFTRALYDDEVLAGLQNKLGTGSYGRTTQVSLPVPEPFFKRLGKNPIALLGIFMLFSAMLILGLTGVNESRKAAQVSAAVLADTETTPTQVGRLSFGTTNSLGDTASLRVENLLTPGSNQEYTVWLINQSDGDYLRLGSLTLDALGSGALVYTDEDGRVLPTAYDGVVISIEAQQGGTGYRTSRSSAASAANQHGPTDLIVYRAVVPDTIAQAVSEILDQSYEGILGSGLLDSAVSEVGIALENTHPDRRSNLGALYTQAERVVNTLMGTQNDLNEDGHSQNPGRGQGIAVFLDRMDAHLERIVEQPSTSMPTQNDIEMIQTCIQNTRTRLDRIFALQARVLESSALNEALETASQSDALLAALIAGHDYNGNGRVEPFVNECGLQQIASFTLLMSSMELTAEAQQQ